MKAETKDKVKIILSEKSVILEGKGDTISIDATIIENNEVLNNPNEKIEFTSSNNDVAYEAFGFIYAEGKGKATITAKYKNIKKTIEVNVLSDSNISDIKNISELKSNNLMSTNGLPSSEVSYILQKAYDMTKVKWTPCQNLYGWNYSNYFKAGQTYTGIPYSQTPNQVDDIDFINSMNNSDFYNPYFTSSKSMSRYGNDCSGFVSFAFYTYRHNTWSLVDDPDITKLSSLDDVQPGDAVVTNQTGIEHTFIIYNVVGDTFYCYEQTPKVALATVHSKSDLLSKGYIGIRNKDWGNMIPTLQAETN